MSKYRKLPQIVEASQWFKNGDHPEDKSILLRNLPKSYPEGYLSEGKIIRYHRTPSFDGQRKCENCKTIMHYHGWFDDVPRGGITVCPSDWIVTYKEGYREVYKDKDFKETFEEINEKEKN